VQAVRQQRHRAINHPGRYFYDHHHRGEKNNDDGALLTRALLVLAEDVVMRPVVQLLRMHDKLTPSKWIAEKANAGKMAIIRFGCV
jgi:hypothetical protein